MHLMIRAYDREIHPQNQIAFMAFFAILDAEPARRMPSDIILQTHTLGKRYRNRWAARNVNLTVRRGEVFGFLGPNGAGKSTTIRMLLSLINPTEGKVELFGKPIRRHRAEVLARVGGLVERADFYLYLTARRNLEIVAALRGDRANIDEVLDIVGLADRAGDRVKTFSHGMKQRLGIAQALLGWPEFIILDEPTSGLDPQGIKEVRDLILRLSRTRGMTILLSSHLLNEIEQTATTMAIINQGAIVVQGNVHDLLNSADNIVRFQVYPVDQALAIARACGGVTRTVPGDSFIDVTMPQEDVAMLNAMMNKAGLTVHSVVPKRSLEEYFLSITEGASDVTPRSRR